jgi:hypothetical protein
VRYDTPLARLRAVLLSGAVAAVLAIAWLTSGHGLRHEEGAAGCATPALVAGVSSWRISARAEAQGWFDRGVALARASDRGAAVRAFRAAQKADPSCAMCFWGEAWALGPGARTPMGPTALPQARAALDHARAAAGEARAMERGLIDALLERYRPDALADPASAAQAYAAAMQRLAARFAGERELAVLEAEALIAALPPDAVDAGHGAAKESLAGIISLLEAALGLAPRKEGVGAGGRLLAPDPGHPGAIDLYITLIEATEGPDRALAAAERLGVARERLREAPSPAQAGGEAAGVGRPRSSEAGLAPTRRASRAHSAAACRPGEPSANSVAALAPSAEIGSSSTSSASAPAPASSTGSAA